VPIAEQQDVIEDLASDAADEALGHGVRVGGPDGDLDDPDSGSLRDAVEGCQRRIVSGWTTTMALRQHGRRAEPMTSFNLSIGASLGLLTCRLRTLSWWRSRAFVFRPQPARSPSGPCRHSRDREQRHLGSRPRNGVAVWSYRRSRIPTVTPRGCAR
jgi:hypothetical protein